MKMDINDAAHEAWKEILGDEGSPSESDEKDQPSDVADDLDDSTPEPGSDGTSGQEPEAEQEADADEEDDGDVDEPEGEPVVINDDDVITFNGKTAKASDLFQMQADYTRKTQELASQREEVVAQAEQVTRVYDEMKQWYESKSSDPVGWLAEIATETGNATRAVALLLTKLNDQGALDKEFAEVFDLQAPDNPVRQTSRDSEVEARIAKLEADRQAAEEAQQSAAAEREAANELNRQVASLIDREGLTFANDRDVISFRIELFETATKAGITDLDTAYELLTARKQRQSAETSRKEKALERKRSSKVTRPEPASVASSEDTQFTSVDDAARAALEALMVPR